MTWRVRWRKDGSGTAPWDGETCDHPSTTLNFAAAVRLTGERRPDGYPKGCRGLKPLPSHTEHELAGVPSFIEVAERYFTTRVNAEPRTIADHRRLVRAHIAAAVVTLPDGRHVGPIGLQPIDETDDPELWQGWVAYMQRKTYGRKVKKHYSAKTISNIFTAVISPVLTFATSRGYCTSNPSREVHLPQAERSRSTSCPMARVTCGVN